MTNSKNINTSSMREPAPIIEEDIDYERVLGRAVLNEVLSIEDAYELLKP